MKGKSVIFFVLLLLDFLPSGAGSGNILFSQNVTINATGASGDNSSVLDLDVDNKGMLIPRVSLTSSVDVLTIISPAISLIIYNTAAAGVYPEDVVPGFYFWDGTKWTQLGGSAGIMAFADFYALMPPDNSATIAAGVAVEFPNAGPSANPGIAAISSTQFQLAAAGTYMVNWQVSINEAAQLVLEVNGTELLSTVVGRATGTSQLAGSRIITTSVANSILRVVNPIGSPTVLTITTVAGGARPVSASLVITRLM